VAACEWDICEDPSTHTVEVRFADGYEETWKVCRSHDRLLKLQTVRGRPRVTPPIEAPPSVTVGCGQCQRPLEEPSNLSAEDRRPCPDCGSCIRHVSVTVAETLTLHDSVRVRAKEAGKGGWRVDTRTGADFTHDLGAWGRLERTKDRGGDLYREVIELYDGTKLTSVARLRDHHG